MLFYESFYESEIHTDPGFGLMTSESDKKTEEVCLRIITKKSSMEA